MGDFSTTVEMTGCDCHLDPIPCHLDQRGEIPRLRSG